MKRLNRLLVLARRSIGLAIGACILFSCGSTQTISEQDINAKLAKIKLGSSTTADVEALFGARNRRDADVWIYNLSDTAVDFIATQPGSLTGFLPVVPTTAATNTKALITVRFSPAGVVKGLEVSRYFDMPFITESWFLVKNSNEAVLETLARTGESSGFKIGRVDAAAGKLLLEDSSSSARLDVVLDQQVLRFTITNPHDRQSNEYRIFTKRESAFVEGLLASELLQ